MFIDSAKFSITSGKGGAGCVSFRREKHVIQGGPDGGDGGDGGDVYFVVDNNSHTLAFYKGRRKMSAGNGEQGMSKRMSGKKGENLYLVVPPGTAVLDDESGEVLLDLTSEGQRELFLRGGKGGLGNFHFKNSVNQAPEYAQPGLAGETKTVRLELKLIADVGLVGFPNVGKSTLISTISNAKPQIANYEFTTLTPKLGQVAVDEFSGFVMADIPGIIEGAADGRGLGLEFLKHIERTKVLLYMIDLASYRTPVLQFRTLINEVAKFSQKLARAPFAVAFTKADAAESADVLVAEFLAEFGFEERQSSEILGEAGLNFSRPLFTQKISSATGEGISTLKFELLKAVEMSR